MSHGLGENGYMATSQVRARFGSAHGRLLTWTLAWRVRCLAPTTISLTKQRHLSVANIKSQIKRIKTNEKARLRNKSVKSSLKTAIRKTREAVESGDVAKAQELAQAASRQLDKAASKGVIHANQAANKKSALAKSVNALQG
jgi:small subunit ribosomal protein S20